MSHAMRPAPVLLALALMQTACMTVSMNTRPRALAPGEVRVGLGQGFSRDVASDFALAEPSTGESFAVAFSTELTAHYGLPWNMDVGMRLRPLSRGVKVEGLVQILDEPTSRISLAAGLGVDRFSRPTLELECDADGCFTRDYAGFMLDVPVVVASRLKKWLTLYASMKYNHLFVSGRQRYESDDGAFPTMQINKRLSQPIYSWTVGVEFAPGRFRLVPQLHGSTIKLPSGSVAHMMYPALDFALVF